MVFILFFYEYKIRPIEKKIDMIPSYGRGGYTQPPSVTRQNAFRDVFKYL